MVWSNFAYKGEQVSPIELGAANTILICFFPPFVFDEGKNYRVLFFSFNTQFS